jgi:histidine ammonia-lyase
VPTKCRRDGVSYSGHGVTLADVMRVARMGVPVAGAHCARRASAHRATDDAQSDEAIYGLTTALGANRSGIPAEEPLPTRARGTRASVSDRAAMRYAR